MERTSVTRNSVPRPNLPTEITKETKRKKITRAPATSTVKTDVFNRVFLSISFPPFSLSPPPPYFSLFFYHPPSPPSLFEVLCGFFYSTEKTVSSPRTTGTSAATPEETSMFSHRVSLYLFHSLFLSTSLPPSLSFSLSLFLSPLFFLSLSLLCHSPSRL